MSGAYKFNHKEKNPILACGGTEEVRDVTKSLYPTLTKFLNHETQSECAEFLVKELEAGNVELLLYVVHLLTDITIGGILAGKVECPEILKEEFEKIKLKEKRGNGGDKEVFVSPEMLDKMHTIH